MKQDVALDKLIGHYSEKFELFRNVDIAGITVPVMASMRHRGPSTIMGFATGAVGPEACEHIFMIMGDSFDEALFKEIEELITVAEQEYVKPSKGHAYTFLSVVVLVKDIQKPAEVLLKKYKHRRDYGKNGWSLTRIVVLCENDEGFCNKDGSDLKKLVFKIVE